MPGTRASIAPPRPCGSKTKTQLCSAWDGISVSYNAQPFAIVQFSLVRMVTAVDVSRAFDRKAFSISQEASERCSELANNYCLSAKTICSEFEAFALSKCAACEDTRPMRRGLIKVPRRSPCAPADAPCQAESIAPAVGGTRALTHCERRHRDRNIIDDMVEVSASVVDKFADYLSKSSARLAKEAAKDATRASAQCVPSDPQSQL